MTSPAADQLADKLEQHGRELLAMAATLRAEAPSAPLANDDMLPVGAVAKALQVSKSAARMKMVRSGNAVRLGGLWHVPRSAISKLYAQRNVRGPQRNVRVIVKPTSTIIEAWRRE